MPATFRLTDLRDLAAAVERVRRLVDADCDPVAIGDAFAGDACARLSRAPHPRAARARSRRRRRAGGACRPGPAGDRRRSADHRRAAHRAVRRAARRRPSPASPTCSRRPPRWPRSIRSRCRCRGRAGARWWRVSRALAEGELSLDRGGDRDDVRRRLLEIPGIGPWTADYIALRALGHPDVFLPTDIGIRDALRGLERDPAYADDLAEDWRPWRSYAQLHLWHTLSPTTDPHSTDPGRTLTMWTVMDSPIGDLRIVEHDGAITAIEFSPFRDYDGRPRGDRDDTHPLLARDGAPAPRLLRPRPQGVRPAAGPEGQRVPEVGLGAAARRSATATPRRTARSPSGSAGRTPRLVPSGWPTAATRSRS